MSCTRLGSRRGEGGDPLGLYVEEQTYDGVVYKDVNSHFIDLRSTEITKNILQIID